MIIKELLKFPMFLLVFASLIAAIYAAHKKINNIDFIPAIIIGIIFIMYVSSYFIGEKNENQ